MNRTTKILIGLLFVAVGASCTVLTTKDIDAIDLARDNAAEWNSRIAGTTQPTTDRWQAVQSYSALNSDNWNRLSNIAHRVTTTAPAVKQ